MKLLYGRDMLEIGTVWRERMKKIKNKDYSEYVGGWRDGEMNGWGLLAVLGLKDNNRFPMHYHTILLKAIFVFGENLFKNRAVLVSLWV